MDAWGFDGHIMWDPEYCDSQLRAVEASGELSFVSLHRKTQLKINRRLTRGTRVTSAWQWHSDTMPGQYMLLGLPILCSTSSRPRCLAEFLFVAVLSIQLGTSF